MTLLPWEELTWSGVEIYLKLGAFSFPGLEEGEGETETEGENGGATRYVRGCNQGQGAQKADLEYK